MNTENPFEILSTKTVYENPWMRVREDAVIRPDGSQGIFGIMESDDSVVILALNQYDEVYLIRSFSYPAAGWFWTLPGGGGNGEDAAVAAKRELEEETGIVASDMVFLGKTRIAGGIITERTSFFLARDLVQYDRPDADDKHLIELGKFVSFDDIDAMLLEGEIDDCQTVTGVYFAKRWLNGLKDN